MKKLIFFSLLFIVGCSSQEKKNRLMLETNRGPIFARSAQDVHDPYILLEAHCKDGLQNYMKFLKSFGWDERKAMECFDYWEKQQ